MSKVGGGRKKAPARWGPLESSGQSSGSGQTSTRIGSTPVVSSAKSSGVMPSSQTSDKSLGKRPMDGSTPLSSSAKRVRSTDASTEDPTRSVNRLSSTTPVWAWVLAKDLADLPPLTQSGQVDANVVTPGWQLRRNDKVIDPAVAKVWNDSVCLPRDLRMFESLSPTEAEQQRQFYMAMNHLSQVD